MNTVARFLFSRVQQAYLVLVSLALALAHFLVSRVAGYLGKREAMQTILYKADVVQYGNSTHFEFEHQLSASEFRHILGSREARTNFLKRVGNHACAKIIAAQQWPCSMCGNPKAKTLVSTPCDYLQQDPPFVMDFLPFPVCGSQSCDKQAKITTAQLMKEVFPEHGEQAAEADLTNPKAALPSHADDRKDLCDVPPLEVQAGSKVEVHSLQSAEGRNMNGCVATVLEFNASSKRFIIQLQDTVGAQTQEDLLKRIKPENLRWANDRGEEGDGARDEKGDRGVHAGESKRKTKTSARVRKGPSDNRKAERALQTAGLSAMKGDWRACADAYKTGYELGAPDWHLGYCCVSGFTSVLRETHFPASTDDLSFLRQLGKAEDVPALHRAQAQFTYGLMKWLGGERESAARNYREAIAIGEKASASDRARKETLPDGATQQYVPKTSGPVLDEVMQGARENLEVLEGQRTGPLSKEESPPGTTQGLAPLKRVHAVPAGPGVHPAVMDQALEQLRVSGSSCDQCGRQRGGKGVASGGEEVNLRMCQRCKRVWYCSAECQRAAWKGGHKRNCRPWGQHSAGDRIQLKQGAVPLKPEYNGCIVEVVGKVAAAADEPSEGPMSEWEVQLLGSDGTTVRVLGKFMEPLRAPQG
ncbi:hypothetical protein CYMTET_40885 [Cymbomonas tetramitiformis]|uniref:MYND-type domain-containing protein n=1 Tax=Cymbomonas tetramitiformis TaxID=36881 RepID=A0AAE0C8H1_9CHLO|nr:hypothetical protein CYMTET_40885 [Cymbomonas tetramitiformis]